MKRMIAVLSVALLFGIEDQVAVQIAIGGGIPRNKVWYCEAYCDIDNIVGYGWSGTVEVPDIKYKWSINGAINGRYLFGSGESSDELMARQAADSYVRSQTGGQWPGNPGAAVQPLITITQDASGTKSETRTGTIQTIDPQKAQKDAEDKYRAQGGKGAVSIYPVYERVFGSGEVIAPDLRTALQNTADLLRAKAEIRGQIIPGSDREWAVNIR
jgi:hypothetical protein